MPLVRMTTSVACEDLPSRPGAEVQLSPERAKQVVAAGWGEIVRDHAPETPEQRVAKPETADAAKAETSTRARRAPRKQSS